MSISILLPGAGGGGSNNLVRALNKSRFKLNTVGTNCSEFTVARANTDIRHLIPHSNREEAYIAALNKLCANHQIDLIIPTNDTETAVVSKYRDKLNAKTCLPSPSAIELCHDKLKFHQFCEKQNIPVAKTVGIESLDQLESVFDTFSYVDTIWCRMRSGNGSMGSLPVKTAEQARFWIKYWVEMRDARVEDFILAEYLPGRDYAIQTLWDNGKLMLAKNCERLSYIFAKQTPAGRFSTPDRGIIVNEPIVNQIVVDAIKKIDAKPNGIYSVDLKEFSENDPRITEINPGRFFRISPSMNLAGKYNMAELFLETALNLEKTKLDIESPFSDMPDEPTYYFCDLDEAPVLRTKSDIASSISILE